MFSITRPCFVALALVLIPSAYNVAHCDQPASIVGPITAPGIVPAAVDGGIEAVNYHRERHPIVDFTGPAPWIWVGQSAPASARPDATIGCFRGIWDIQTAPTHVDAWVSADLHYRLWINGVLVSRGPADSGTDYMPIGANIGKSGVWFADYHDIASYLHKGRNIVAAEVFTQQICNWYGSSGHSGFLFKAISRNKGGQDQQFQTDGSWKTNLLDYFSPGVTYTPGREPANWRLLDFDDSGWFSAASIDASPWPKLLTSELDAQLEANVPFERIVPDGYSSASPPSPNFTNEHPYTFAKDGIIRLSLDRVVSGYITTTFSGGAGAKLIIALNELNAPDGHRAITINLSGGDVTIETPFYSSFKYVNVIASNISTQPIVIKSLRAVFTSDPVEYTGSFSCSDDFLNRLWLSSRWQTQMCMQDHDLDSPDHQEPICDFGDYLIESRVNEYCFAQYALIRQDIKKFGSLLAVNNYLNFHESYALLWLQTLVEYYMETGDKSLLIAEEPVVRGLLDRFESWRGANGLISQAPDYMFMDWVSIDGIPCHHPPAVIGQGYLTAFYYHALADASVVASITGGHADQAHYQSIRRDIYTAFNRELWDDQKGLYRDGKPFVTTVKPSTWLPADTDIETFSPHVNSLAVLYDLAPENRRLVIMKNLLSSGPINAQPYFYYFIFAAMEKAGVFDNAAVTQMHRWTINSDTKTFQEMWGNGDYSHGWGGSPAIYMSETILGVKPAKPGFKAVSIKPHLCNLSWVKGVVPTPLGPVAVSWNVTAKGLALTTLLPRGMTGDVLLPLSRFSHPLTALDGAPIKSGFSQPVRIGSGAHRFTIAGAYIPAEVIGSAQAASSTTKAVHGDVTSWTDTDSQAAFEPKIIKQSLIMLGQSDCVEAQEINVGNAGGGANSDAVRNGTTLNGSGGAQTMDDGKTFRGYGAGSSVIFQLNNTKCPRGYDIDKIATFAGHFDGRASQSYSVSAAFATDSKVFKVIVPDTQVTSGGGSTELLIANKSGGVLTNGSIKATGVVAIRFDFADGPEGFNVYRELQVAGKPTK
jgi:hypothetical protein